MQFIDKDTTFIPISKIIIGKHQLINNISLKYDSKGLY